MTDDERLADPEWDPFAGRRGKRQAQREPATPAVTWGGQPIQSTPEGTSGSWGAGAGRPTEPVSSPDAKMGRLIRDGARWLRHGIPPERDEPGPVR